MGKHSSKLQASDSKRLMELISRGNKSSVEDFLTAKGVSVNKGLHVYIGTFLLHVAVDAEPENYHHDLVEYFISKGADLNVRDTCRGYAPLHYAAIHVNATAARALIDAGADVNLPCRCCHHEMRLNGNKLILSKHRHGLDCPLHIMFTELIYESMDHRTKRNVSAAATIDLVKLLLSHGADCNLFDHSGTPPLHYAVELDDVTLACLLLDAGANVNIRLVNSTTPIFHARSVSMLKLLLSRNADTEAEAEPPDRGVRILLHWSVHYLKCDIIKCLVSEMPVLLHWNGINISPLAVAVQKCISTRQYKARLQMGEIICLMIKAGCDPLTKVLERQEWDRDNINNSYDRCLVRDPSIVGLFKVMEEIASAPRSLLNLCIIRIRGILKKNISSVVDFLPLPANLKRSLTLAN